MNKLVFSSMALLLSALFVFETLAQDAKSPNSRPKPPKFSTFDSDANGEITLEEFKQKRPPHKTAEEVFAMIDTDENGLISEDEFKAHKPPKRHRKSKKQEKNG